MTLPILRWDSWAEEVNLIVPKPWENTPQLDSLKNGFWRSVFDVVWAQDSFTQLKHSQTNKHWFTLHEINENFVLPAEQRIQKVEKLVWKSLSEIQKQTLEMAHQRWSDRFDPTWTKYWRTPDWSPRFYPNGIIKDKVDILL
jgi:hypothetical protein